jgi:hypothetical protein
MGQSLSSSSSSNEISEAKALQNEIDFLEKQIHEMNIQKISSEKVLLNDFDLKIKNEQVNCSDKLSKKQEHCSNFISDKINSLQLDQDKQMRNLKMYSDKNIMHVKLLEQKLADLEYRLENKENNSILHHRLAIDSARANVLEKAIEKIEKN